MNQSLVYLNKILTSENSFEAELKSYNEFDASLTSLKKVILSSISTIGTAMSNLTKVQEKELLTSLELLIAKVNSLYTKYTDDSDYFYERRYEAFDWGMLEGKEDKDESQKSYLANVQYYESIRKGELTRLAKLTNVLEEIRTAFNDLNYNLSIKQIEVTGTQMKNILQWNNKDTDLLELIVALCESKSIDNPTHDLSRAEAVKIFSQLFGITILDSERKLTAAKRRKKELTPFLNKLKESFEMFAQRKDEK